ncbi:hypothetical protein Pmani_004218 [Petrolisthes manimaculis]|uniref:MYND-type domain-containing protein n=1 Tax=Petrolisthes manimaculis TaxID=1843537 RepID=A0AAE1QH97_9EUCA|nr:hypothetical protein Pmani_004218 [Petrolisthes manimaculis]
MHSQPPLPGQISSVDAVLEDLCIDPSRLEKVPRVILKRLTQGFIKKWIRPPQKSLNEDEDSFSSNKKNRTFTDCPALPLSPSDNLHPLLSTNMGILSALTPTSPFTCVSPPLKENAPAEPSTSIDSNLLNDMRSVLTVGDDDRDSDDEEYLPDLTDPSWEAPSTKKKKLRSPDDKIERKKKTLDTSNFNKGRDPKLMKDARKVFKQKQKMFIASKTLSGVKSYGKSTESAQDLKPSDSGVSTSPSQLPTKLLNDLPKTHIQPTTEPSPNDSEIEKRKAQIRENISRGFPQKSFTSEPIPIPEENLPLNEEVTMANEDNNDGQSIAVISDIQGNAISVFANNCDANEEGYDSDQTITFESPVLSDANLLDETNNLTQHTISEPTHDSREYKSKRKYDIQADEGKRKKDKCSSEQPKTHQKKNMVTIHSNISPLKSSDLYPEAMIVKVESIGNKIYQSGGNATSGDDLAPKMTSSGEDYLESKVKNWCASPKRSTDDKESVNAQAVGDSGNDDEKHLAHTKLILSKLNKLDRQRKQCDEKIKQAWEEHNKKIAVLEEQKAKYEKEMENLMTQHIGGDNISHTSVRNQPTACIPDNSCTEKGQNNLQEESASVLPGPSVSQTESVPLPLAGSIPTTKASVAQAVFLRSTPVSSPNKVTPQPPPPQLPVAAQPSTLGTPEPVPTPSTSLSSNTFVPEEGSSKDTEGTKGISIIRQASISQFGKKRSGKKKDKGVKFRVVAKSSLPVTTSVQTKPVEEITRQPARSNTAVGPVQHNNNLTTPYYSKNIAPPNVVVSNRMPLPTVKQPPTYTEHLQTQIRQNLPGMSNNNSSGNLLFIPKGQQQQQQHPQLYIMQPQPQVQEQHVIMNPPNHQQAQQVYTQQPQIQKHNHQQAQQVYTQQPQIQKHNHQQAQQVYTQQPQIQKHNQQQAQQVYTQQPQIQKHNQQQAQQVYTQQPQIQKHNHQQQLPLMTSQHYVQHQQQQPVQQLVTCPQSLFPPQHQKSTQQQQQQQQPQQQSVGLLQHLLKNGPRPHTQNQQEHSRQPFSQNTLLMQPQQSCMSAVTQNTKSQQRNSTKPNNIGQQPHAVGSITASSTPVHSHQSHLLVSATPSQPQPGHSIARPVHLATRPAHPTPQASQIQPKLSQTIQPVRTAIQGSNSLPQLSPHQPQEGTELRQEEVLPDSPVFSLESCSCFICGSAGEYTCCSGIVYCSRDCQAKDWHRHREECTKIK